MKLSSIHGGGLQNWIRGCLLTVLMIFSLSASAQGILSQAQTGTIQELGQDDGFVTISGRNYGWDNEIAQVTLGGEPLDSGFLDEGMVVRFTLDRAGNLVQVEVIGPISETEILQQH